MENSFITWLEIADKYMHKHYSITLVEGIGLEMDYLKAQHAGGMRPDEFCEWLASKYDLIEFEAFSVPSTTQRA